MDHDGALTGVRFRFVLGDQGVRGYEVAGEVVVVGAGVSGLTTAVVLAERGVPTRVLSAEPPQETTSVAAGALWGPSFQQPYDKTLEWTARSLEDFQNLAAEPGTGVRIADVLTVGGGELPAELPPQVALIPGLRAATTTSCRRGTTPDRGGGCRSSTCRPTSTT